MKVRLFIGSILLWALLFVHGTAYSCSVLNKEEARTGMDRGFRGICSNNGYPMSCFLKEGSWVQCYGPRGSNTGTNLRSLIYDLCGCTEEDERMRRLEEQMFND